MKISRHRKSRQATGGPGNGTRNQETQEQILTAHEGKGEEDTKSTGGTEGVEEREGETAVARGEA